MSKFTLTFSDKAKGWTSFHSYLPDWMMKLNNRFFSIKNGQLYLHNDQTNPVRNNFYGEQFNSKMVTLINEANSEDKIFKTLVLEGNLTWDATIKTNLTESTIKSTEFNTRESRHFAYVRRNEIAADLHGHSGIGIGNIISAVGFTVTLLAVPSLLSIGDKLWQLNGAIEEPIGIITAINGAVVTLDAIETTPVVGYYSYAKKNPRVEGGDIRGYYSEITLVNSNTEPVELFAIESNIIKSYV